MEFGVTVFIVLLAILVWWVVIKNEEKVRDLFRGDRKGGKSSAFWSWLRVRFTPGQRLGLSLTLGLFVAILAAFLFGLLADQIAEKQVITQYDLTFGKYLLGGATLVGSRLFYMITEFGSVLFLIPAFVFMSYWLWSQNRKKDILIYLLAIGGGVLLNLLLKTLFGRARPDYTNAFYHEIGYSFPSGHSMMSILFYGMTVYLILQTARSFRLRAGFLIGGTALILLIGFSRLYLGVHFLSDVIGGWAAGGVWLATCIIIREFVTPRELNSTPSS